MFIIHIHHTLKYHLLSIVQIPAAGKLTDLAAALRVFASMLVCAHHKPHSQPSASWTTDRPRAYCVRVLLYKLS